MAIKAKTIPSAETTPNTVPETPHDTSRAVVPCPRCAKPLTDPEGLGWCQECGYCKSLEDPATKKLVETEPAKPAPATVAVQQAGQLVSNIPYWSYILVAGVFFIVVLTILANRRLPAQNDNPLTPTQAGHGLARAQWTTLQIGVGLLVIFFAQVVALVRVAPADPNLSFKDVFLPFRLWGQVFYRRRRIYMPIVLAGWGIAIAVSAVIFIGGLGHWMSHIPKSNAQKVSGK